MKRGPRRVTRTPAPAAAINPWAVRVDILLAACLALVSGLTFVHVFTLRDLLPRILLSATLPAAAIALVGTSRLASGIAGAITVPACVLACSPGSPTTALAAVVGGWARILDSSLPAAASPEQVPVVVAVVASASAAGAFAARREFSALLVVAPSFTAFIVARALGTRPHSQTLLLFALAWAGVTAVLLMRRANSILAIRRCLSGLLVASIAISLGVAVGPVLPSAGAFDPSRLRHHPSSHLDQPDVLSEIRALQSQPERPLLSANISAEGLPKTSPLFVRLAIMDKFDGWVWSSSGDYGAMGDNVPGAPPGSPRSVRLSETFVIQETLGPWIPVVGDPITVTTPRQEGIAFNASTGALALATGPRASDRFLITAQLPVLDDYQLVSASADPNATRAAFDLPERFPKSFTDYAHGAAGSGTTFARVSRLQTLFRQRLRFDPYAPSGHTLRDLAAFLDPSSGRRGGSEQYAAAFALLARAAGVPSRVVVGFQTTPGVQLLTTHQLQAWPEVALAGLGWVPLTPETRDSSKAKSQQLQESAASKAAAKLADGSLKAPSAGAPPNDASTLAPEPRHHASWPTALIATLLLLAGAVLFMAWRLFRRRRQNAGKQASAEGRIAGAWRTARDLLSARGLRSQPSATPAEVVDAARTAEVGDRPCSHLTNLQVLIEAAIYAPPGSVTDADAATAQFALTEFRRLLLREIPAPRRQILAVVPRLKA
jgi:transglutaminase-like putative cysteine protease